ncbi:MAG: hypothetical protein KDC80_00355 [Saprospiraceae bacterium]|nr:hypothetical protein [Saprospiraceae bacterium]
MKHDLCLLVVGLLLVWSCSKSDQESPLECSLSASINDTAWCGQVFEIFQDDQNHLVINASRETGRNQYDVDQITIYVPDFNGDGTYQLKDEGGVYRKWCCGDLILALAILDVENNDSGQVIIETFDTETKEIRGTFNFTASGENHLNVHGEFFGTKK